MFNFCELRRLDKGAIVFITELTCWFVCICEFLAHTEQKMPGSLFGATPQASSSSYGASAGGLFGSQASSGGKKWVFMVI
jgi:hypothetical protein